MKKWRKSNSFCGKTIIIICCKRLGLKTLNSLTSNRPPPTANNWEHKGEIADVYLTYLVWNDVIVNSERIHTDECRLPIAIWQPLRLRGVGCRGRGVQSVPQLMKGSQKIAISRCELTRSYTEFTRNCHSLICYWHGMFHVREFTAKTRRGIKLCTHHYKIQ